MKTQTNVEISEYRPDFDSDPKNKEQRRIKNRGKYLRKIERNVECKPDYGVSFDCAAVQLNITTWGIS